VIGPSAPSAAQEETAREVGRLLAERNCIVLTGGLGGVMEAASRGATEAGGTCLGLLPGADRSSGNQHLTIAVATGMGELRNGLLVRSADAVIAVGGSWGTLSEIALATTIGRPLVVIGGWALHDESGSPVDLRRADTAIEAVAAIEALLADS
jgi:uncharacterized protein (TIGR00725 family)